MERTRTTRVIIDYTIEPEPVEEVIIELEDINTLDDFQFVYALALRAMEHESLACETNTARAQVAHLLDRLTSIEWLVAK